MSRNSANGDQLGAGKSSEAKIMRFVGGLTYAWVAAAILLTIAPISLLIISINEKSDMYISDTLEGKKDVLRNRVNNLVQIIAQQQYVAMEAWKKELKIRSKLAMSIADEIYESNKNRLGETEIKRMIVDRLSLLRMENGELLTVISDPKMRGVLTNNPIHTGKDMGFILDESGKPIFAERTKTAEENEEGEFLMQRAPRFSDTSGRIYTELVFVTKFKPYNWIFSSSSYIDDLEFELRKTVLKMMAGLRYEGGNYVWVDSYDGYALLNNGRFLEVPEYIWNITDQNGLKPIQEQLKVALDNPKGGFLQYDWYEKETKITRPYLSFVRALPDWKWKIGSGMYMDNFKAQIDPRIEQDRQRNTVWFVALGCFNICVFGALYIVSLRTNAKIHCLFKDMDAEIALSKQDLILLNAKLREKVDAETKQRLKNEDMLIYTSKLADMGNMLGLIAHQWKQPLNALTMTLDEFSQCAGDREKTADLIAACQKQINYAIDTIADFTNFLKPNAKPSKFSLNDLLVSAQRLLAPRINAAKTIVEMPAEEITVTSYQNELRQILINIYGNACDANEARLKKGEIKNGTIKIEAEVKDDKVFLSISDNGGGIPSDIIDNIFEAYFTSKGEKGTGLGLYMSRKIAEERLGGSLVVENTRIGARFTLTIPITPPTPSSSSSSNNPKSTLGSDQEHERFGFAGKAGLSAMAPNGRGRR